MVSLTCHSRFREAARPWAAVCVLIATLGVLAGAERHRSAGAAEANRAAGPPNLALGAKYTLRPAPNYRYCTDPQDDVQLTDGQSTTAYFWTQKGTVGWQGAAYCVFTVDMGRIEPIGGVAMTTAAGKAGVTWPAAIRVLTSDDGKTYRDAGDLVAMDRKVHGPWPEGYAIRRLETGAVRTRGRFLRLVAIPPAGGPYFFTDEVEVLRGPDELLRAEPAGEPVADVDDLFVRWRSRSAIAHRLDADAAALETAVGGAALADEALRGQLLGRLDRARGAFDPDAIRVDRSFRAVLPLDAAHGRLFGVQAQLWRAMGRPTVVAEAAVAWDPLDPFAPPPQTTRGRIEVHTMLGEYRSAAVNLYNAGDEPLVVRVSLEGLPGAPAPAYVSVHEVQWTDTGRGVPVAAALPEAARRAGAWTVGVPPGLVRQVWFTCHAAGVAPGTYDGHVLLECPAGEPLEIPIRLRVYPLEFPARPALWLGGWSYTNGRGSYGITPENRQSLVEHLREHFVSAPWAGSSVLMKFKFADGTDRVEIDSGELDAWLAEWPDARAYLVFLAVGDYSGSSKAAFAGAEPGTPEFDRRVGAWISAWVRHLRSKGIGPDRLGLLIHDEPHEGSDLTALLAWARAIRAAEPEVLVWEDPTYRDPVHAPAELFEVCDVLCPNRPMWLAAGKPFADFYVDQHRRGKVLHSYSCSGPARLLDPYAYYRLQAWHCWRYGGTGSFFWAFGDNGGASSWNEYLAKAGPYTPLFIDPTSVVAGKHMEAVRESVEDFETLVMLRRAVERARAAGGRQPEVERAERLLESAAADVLDAEGAPSLDWHAAKDRTIADAVRARLLEALTALR